MENKKVLYFEGAGWSGADISRATVGNCRIRTAFHRPDGTAVYLEMTGSERTKRNAKDPHSPYRWQYTGFIMDCFQITDEIPNDDCNNHRIHHPDIRTFEWSNQGILETVNAIGGDFDEVMVLPDLGGYRVFADVREGNRTKPSLQYHYGDTFHYDPEAIARREQVYHAFYEADRNKGIRYPNFSLWVDKYDPGLLHLARHQPGDAGHYTLRTDLGPTFADWMQTMTLIDPPYRPAI